MSGRIDVVGCIKETIDIRQCCERYGVTFNSRGMACCPFHDDRHPSASLKNGRFHCFVCDLHLDVIAFVMQLYNCDFRSALRQLNADFGLRLNLDKPIETQEMRRIAAERKKKERELLAYREEYNAKMHRFCAIRDTKKPEPGEDAGEYALLLAELDRLEDWFATHRWR